MFDYLDSVLNGSGITAYSPSGLRYPYDFTTKVANVIIIIAAGASLISLAYSFIQFVTSVGDPKAIDKAKNNLIWSVVAFIVAVTAFMLKDIIFDMLGVISGIL